MVIRWKYEALSDIDDIFDRIHADDPEAAGKVVEHILVAVRVLTDPRFRRLGRPGRVHGTRELVLSIPYVVPYRESEDAIEILAVIHTAREWPKKFEEL